MIIEDKLSVIHQYHSSLWEPPNAAQLCEKNRLLIEKYTRRENKCSVNLIKLWSGN